MGKAFAWLLNVTNGWKTVLAYLLANIPLITDHPLLLQAIQKVMENPSDPKAVGDLVIQVLFVIGVGHIIFKNTKG